jgi:hypothetical protein
LAAAQRQMGTLAPVRIRPRVQLTAVRGGVRCGAVQCRAGDERTNSTQASKPYCTSKFSLRRHWEQRYLQDCGGGRCNSCTATRLIRRLGQVQDRIITQENSNPICGGRTRTGDVEQMQMLMIGLGTVHVICRELCLFGGKQRVIGSPDPRESMGSDLDVQRSSSRRYVLPYEAWAVKCVSGVRNSRRPFSFAANRQVEMRRT